MMTGENSKPGTMRPTRAGIIFSQRARSRKIPRPLRIEITERQENHFKGTLTSDDGPTTWGITGTVANGEVQWQWGDMACKDGCSSEKFTNNCRFAGTCKDGIVQGRFSTLDNAQTGSLRAVLVGLKSATGQE